MPIGLFIALFGYLLGSVPTGLLLTRLFSKKDPRQAGSKNIGATNIYRTAGKKLGLLTLLGDVLKGVIPIGIAMRLAGEQWGLPSDVWIAVAGLSPIVGHIFPIFLGFKGGKGVATALGIYLPISPIAVLIEFFVFAGIVWKWRFVSSDRSRARSPSPFSLLFSEVIPRPTLFSVLSLPPSSFTGTKAILRGCFRGLKTSGKCEDLTFNRHSFFKAVLALFSFFDNRRDGPFRLIPPCSSSSSSVSFSSLMGDKSIFSLNCSEGMTADPFSPRISQHPDPR